MPRLPHAAALGALACLLVALCAGCAIQVHLPGLGPGPCPTAPATATVRAMPLPATPTAPMAAPTPTRQPDPATATAVAPAPTPAAPPPTTAPPPILTPPAPTPAPPPTSTPPAPPATPSPAPDGRRTTVSVQTVTIRAYPYEPFLQDALDAASGIAYKKLNWEAYEASGPQPAPRSFSAVVLENDQLRLTFLPGLGGRLYRAVHKPTGRDLFYVNPVLKPTRWGPAQQGWWLGAGGIEWCLPVDEHGLEWALPWEYSTARSASAAGITLWDSRATDRLRARITVALPDGAARFSITARLENPTGAEKRYQFWLNAMVSGPGNRVPSGLVFMYPTNLAIVHSTDDTSLPPPRDTFAWPVINGRDLSRFADWPGYLGIFALTPGGRQGVYDPAAAFGLVRTYPADVARGAKLFVGKGLDPSLWTDGGSTYVELWGGANRTFFPEDDGTLAPGAAIEWTETWSVTTSGF